MQFILFPLLIAISTSAVPENDVLLNALTDELNRSMQQLKIGSHKKPYYMSYHVNDNERTDITASFGAITKDSFKRNRDLTVDVHVGDYKLDSGNMPRVYSSLTDYDKLAIDDNYDAIRHALWLQTDKMYKSAVHNLERKEAILQDKNIKSRPDDWSSEKPIIEIQPKRNLVVDRNHWKTHTKNLSSIFKNYPRIKQSSVNFTKIAQNVYFINSEGTQSRIGEGNCWLTAKATAQGDDGMKISDSLLISAIDEKHLPTNSELEIKIKQLAERLSKATESNEAEIYQGPILLEGEAAAEFFNKAFVPYAGIKREFDTKASKRMENPLQERIGRRIMPSFISVIDDPTLKDDAGNKVPGSYDVDDQGVRSQRVDLVDKGILKTLLSTRLPTLKIKNSNGHAYGKYAEASNLIVESNQKLTKEELKAKLLKLGKDDGLEYVLIVRKLSSNTRQDGYDSGAMGFLSMAFSDENTKNKVNLPMPTEISRLYIADGHEEVIKGAEFETCTTRILRDIVAAGDDPKMYYFQQGVSTITTPSIILENIEIQKSNSDLERLPVLPHPYFEKLSNKKD